MNVDHILSEKGRSVATIGPDRPLIDVTRELVARRIGAIVVTDDDSAVLGIISERDIVRAVSEHGPAVLEEPVSRYMTKDVVTCSGRAGINELMEIMTNGRFRHIPVCEGGRLAGIVSIGDVVKRRLEEIESEHRAMREYIATA